MRYKGPDRNWWPIVLLSLLIVVVLAALYYFFFMAPPPAGVDPTATPGIVPTGSPAP